MSVPILFGSQALPVPSNTCWTTPQAFFDLFVQYMTGSLPGGFSGVIISDVEPGINERDKLWIKLVAGMPEGFFLFYSGAWNPALPNPIAPGTIVFDGTNYGNQIQAQAAIYLIDGGTAGNPFWSLCDGNFGTPNLLGRVPACSGQGGGLTLRNFGDALGVETHVLTLNEIPNHTHGMPNDVNGIRTTLGPGFGNNNDDAAAGGAGFMGRSTFASEGGGAAHINMQPTGFLWARMRTARIF